VTGAKTKKLALSYEGSVKHVWEASDEPESLWFEFSDDYSVFDWGKMPDKIDHKGRALALIGAFFFEQLKTPEFWASLPESKHLKKFDAEFLRARFNNPVFSGAQGLTTNGLRTHFKSLSDEDGNALTLEQASKHAGRILMHVERAEIFRPELSSVFDQPIFFYPPQSQDKGTRLIPLEVVFRFGMPAGSSLEQRLSTIKDYGKTLGFTKEPRPNEWFDFPVLEFFTKLEPKDRFLSVQEAALLSGLTATEFNKMTELALDISLALHEIFARAGIELWDGKVELLASESSSKDTCDIVLADSVGPDELRLLFDGQQLSKEMIRQFYRGSEWEKTLKKAQQIAFERGTTAWKEICIRELESTPNQLSAEFKESTCKLYCVLANALINPPPFDNHPDLPTFGKQVKALSGSKTK
jgi:phosphoribosylaminoimidazole-succinocarboxamide synthase